MLKLNQILNLEFYGHAGSLVRFQRTQDRTCLIEGLERDVIELREMQDRVHELTIRIGTLEALFDTRLSESTN